MKTYNIQFKKLVTAEATITARNEKEAWKKFDSGDWDSETDLDAQIEDIGEIEEQE